MSLEEADKTESTKFVQAQVIEKPYVSWRPYNSYPYRQVLYGAAGGLFLGILVALAAELLGAKVRFKSDIELWAGVPVTAVFPPMERRIA